MCAYRKSGFYVIAIPPGTGGSCLKHKDVKGIGLVTISAVRIGLRPDRKAAIGCSNTCPARNITLVIIVPGHYPYLVFSEDINAAGTCIRVGICAVKCVDRPSVDILGIPAISGGGKGIFCVRIQACKG